MKLGDDSWSKHPSYEVLRTAIDTLNAGLIARAPDGCILYANDEMRRWLGYTSAELMDRNATLIIPPEIRDAVEEQVQLVLAGDERPCIGVLQRKNGRTFPVVSAASVLREGTEIVAIVTVFLDLGEIQTARKIGAAPAAGLAATLDRIARELQTISLFAGATAVPEVPHDHPDLEHLSKREREILAELLAGARAPAIAAKLFISPHTVRNHLKSMYRKLDVPDQAALIERVRSLAGRADEGADA